MTNLLAKELMQEDPQPAGHGVKKMKGEEPVLEGAGSLEDLLDENLSRAN